MRERGLLAIEGKEVYLAGGEMRTGLLLLLLLAGCVERECVLKFNDGTQKIERGCWRASNGAVVYCDHQGLRSYSFVQELQCREVGK